MFLNIINSILCHFRESFLSAEFLPFLPLSLNMRNWVFEITEILFLKTSGVAP